MSLDPDIATVLFQIANFLILAALLYRFLFRPLMKGAKERMEEKERLLAELDHERDQAEKLRVELAGRLAHANEEAESIRARARQETEELLEATLREAQVEVERILAEAHIEARRLHREALEAVQAEALDTILEISADLIGRTTPSEFHETLVQQLSDRIWEMGRSEMLRVETFRRSLGDRAPTAYVTTALPLSPEQQGLLARTFSALADRNVNLELKTDAALAAGLRVRLGDILVDNSVAGQLEALRQSTWTQLEASAGNE
jgi:F-type H+-transporting ATPase subunit b